MGFGTGFGEFNFDPAAAGCRHSAAYALTRMAEQSIVDRIMEAAYAAEGVSDGCLRFVRFLLAISRSARFGLLPNFADPDSVREVARQFIRYSGSAAAALYTMNQLIEGEAY